MKRTVPLLITAIAGIVLIASRFIPQAQTWGEDEAIWFDVLAAIAFVLGGGNLLKLHLKKISDRAAGWGYSAITLAAFLATLIIGAAKFGVPPSREQEAYGRTFVPLDVQDIPDSAVVRIPATIPPRADDEPPPLSVVRQLSEEGQDLVFRGWMTPRQKADLSRYNETLAWQCTVERLFDEAQPRAPLRGKVEYLADHRSLVFRGLMTVAERNALLALQGNARWNDAVQRLFEQSNKETSIGIARLPNGFMIPETMRPLLSYTDRSHRLTLKGPMSAALRGTLSQANFPIVRPLTIEGREQFRRQLESRGPGLNKRQVETLGALLTKTWLVEKLESTLDAAGKAVEPEKSACELFEAQQAARKGAPVAHTAAAPPAGPKKRLADQTLNDRQKAEIARFVADSAISVKELGDRLRAAGPYNDSQADALTTFFAKVPTVGERNLELCLKLLREGPLSKEQRNDLVSDYREQDRWRKDVGRLFVAAHTTKYSWSGQYVAQGSAFGWIYEFIFKPLQATMFALLAFYVSSAAFRAFRAKNLEAVLLLGTAFIILLGQTFAGQLATSWIPAGSPLAVFKIERLMGLVGDFQTAGQRAIMIGIALGIASTSLKILLGIDRSYLGTGEG